MIINQKKKIVNFYILNTVNGKMTDSSYFILEIYDKLVYNIRENDKSHKYLCDITAKADAFIIMFLGKIF